MAKTRDKNPVAELRSKSQDELQKLLADARADLLESQKSLKANELANPHAVTKLKKEIARILTIITEVSSPRTSEASGEPGLVPGERNAGDPDKNLDSRVKPENDKPKKTKKREEIK